MSLPEEEVRALRIEAQNIVTQRKAEEERDLHKIRSSGSGAKDGLLSNSSKHGGDRNSSTLTDRTDRANQAKALGAAASASGRVNQQGVSDPRFASGSSINQGKIPSLDLSKVSFPPSGITRPIVGPAPSSSSSSSSSRFDAGTDEYDINIGSGGVKPQQQRQGRGQGQGSSQKPNPSSALAPLNSSPPVTSTTPKISGGITRRPAPPPLNPTQQGLARLDQTHAAFNRPSDVGSTWRGEAAPGEGSPVLAPPPGVRAPPMPGRLPPLGGAAGGPPPRTGGPARFAPLGHARPPPGARPALAPAGMAPSMPPGYSPRGPSGMPRALPLRSPPGPNSPPPRLSFGSPKL